MTKKLLIILPLIALLFTSCGTRSGNATQAENISSCDDGVVINGIRWATRNVDAPGTFVQNPEDAGMIFQWGRRKGWNLADEEKEGWHNYNSEDTEWYAENDPCPQGWRVPTIEDFNYLQDANSEWITQNGVTGRLFGTAPNQIFLPATGWLGNSFWSSQTLVGEAATLWIYSDFVKVQVFWHQLGLSVRCVAIE
jgi:hypothetical protein